MRFENTPYLIESAQSSMINKLRAAWFKCLGYYFEGKDVDGRKNFLVAAAFGEDQS